MASRKHLVAVNRTIGAVPAERRAGMAATVELARELARSMDAKSGSVTPALASTYRAVLNDLARAIEPLVVGVEAGAKGPETPVSEPQQVPEVPFRRELSTLERFRLEHGIQPRACGEEAS